MCVLALAWLGPVLLAPAIITHRIAKTSDLLDYVGKKNPRGAGSTYYYYYYYSPIPVAARS